MESKLSHMNQNNPKKQFTTNYDMFKWLPGNREISPARVEAIRKSIEEYGQLNPIIVNEKLQIIDGQARLAACKLLGIPVWYIVCPGLTWEHCVIMNSIGKNWTMKNYVDAYADHGSKEVSEQYKDLKDILSKPKIVKTITQNIIFKVCMNDFGGQKLTDKVKNGTFKFARSKEETMDILNYIVRFADILERVGRKEFLIPILVKCYEDNRVGNEKLFKQCIRYQNKIHGVGNTKEALEMMNLVYNFGAKKNRIWLEEIYNKKAI